MNSEKLPSKINYAGKLRHPDGSSRTFLIEDEIVQRQSNYPNKFFVLQKLKFDNDNVREIRLGYYIIGIKPKMKGKWTWGQFCPLLPKSDFEELIKTAVSRGWLTI
jgi:hypothetical protein